jgi:predicted RNA-binding Zn ribbon-like protein
MKETLATEKFIKVGNNLSLDFINTKIAENGSLKDLLENFTDLAAWAVAANLLEKSEAERLIDQWKDSAESSEAFARAIEFRETLREMFVNLTRGKTIGKAVIAAINREIQNQSGAIEIKKTENGFEKLFRADFSEPRQLLAPVAESAADLLCYGNPLYLKKCENPECVLHFYDATKNHTRRWCSMAACGNRAKAAAFYERKRRQTEN